MQLAYFSALVDPSHLRRIYLSVRAGGLSDVARKKTPRIRVNVKASLSRRLREVRQDLFGEHGGPELARRLNLPARTWYNYETGVTVPAEVLLSFIDQTGASPIWLLTGNGSKYHRFSDEVVSELSPIELIRRGLEKLERESKSSPSLAIDNIPGDAASEFIPVPLIPVGELTGNGVAPDKAEGFIMAFRQWLPNPDETVGVRLDDDSMNPILPAGSIVAVDRSVVDPEILQGRIVAANPEGNVPVIRWLDFGGRHLILRPNQPSKEHPLIPVEIESQPEGLIIGQVVWSWSRFGTS